MIMGSRRSRNRRLEGGPERYPQGLEIDRVAGVLDPERRVVVAAAGAAEPGADAGVDQRIGRDQRAGALLDVAKGAGSVAVLRLHIGTDAVLPRPVVPGDGVEDPLGRLV